MKKNKRIFALCLVATILLSGCNNNAQTSSQPVVPGTSIPVTSASTTSSSVAESNVTTPKNEWTGTQITNPVNIERYNQFIDRIVTNLEANGIEVIDDTETAGAVITTGTDTSTPSTEASTSEAASIPGLDSSGTGEEASIPGLDSSGTSEADRALLVDTPTPLADSPITNSGTTTSTKNKSDDKYLELSELYPVYEHLFKTDTGEDKASFDSKMALIHSYLNPEEKYSDEDIFPALRDSWYEQHKTWIPARWEVLINTNTTTDETAAAPSGIYDIEYLNAELDLLGVLGIMFNCPSDAEVASAPRLDNWTIVDGTTTDMLYSLFANKAAEFGYENRQIDKIINGMGTAKLPTLPYIEYYNTDTPKDNKNKSEKINFAVDKTDYYNFFYTLDSKGWASTAYKRDNALQIVLWEFMTKVTTNLGESNPALTAYFADNISYIYDEMQAILADDKGNYIPKYDGEALAKSQDNRWYTFHITDKDAENDDFQMVINNPNRSYNVEWSDYEGYLSFLDKNFKASSSSLQGTIDSYLSVNTGITPSDTTRLDVGTQGGSTSLSVYEYLTQGLAMENKNPIAWTAFVNYLHDGMLAEDENGLALYKGAWKELNDIVKIDDTSFESVFYTLQDDTEVAYSDYGVIFGSGIPATLACNSAGGRGTYDWQLQWVFPEGRVKLSELKETLSDYIVLVGALTNNDYANAIDIAISGAINKTDKNGYVFGIDYVDGAAMLTIAKV